MNVTLWIAGFLLWFVVGFLGSFLLQKISAGLLVSAGIFPIMAFGLWIPVCVSALALYYFAPDAPAIFGRLFYHLGETFCCGGQGALPEASGYMALLLAVSYLLLAVLLFLHIYWCKRIGRGICIFLLQIVCGLYLFFYFFFLLVCELPSLRSKASRLRYLEPPGLFEKRPDSKTPDV